MALDFLKFNWLNPPSRCEADGSSLIFYTDSNTDFWQRTYYGFRNDNAHAFTFPTKEAEFSFMVKAVWNPANLFDQCGVVLYQNSDNWFKASVEFESPQIAKLGSVVTNLGYSDWATTDVDAGLHEMSYRLSRRGQDFCVENSADGVNFKQMRIFHMHQPIAAANIGVYGCSPIRGPMKVEFTGFGFGPCQWKLFEALQ